MRRRSPRIAVHVWLQTIGRNALASGFREETGYQCVPADVNMNGIGVQPQSSIANTGVADLRSTIEIILFTLTSFACFPANVLAQESDAAPKRVQLIVQAAGGESKLFKLFLMKERYNAGAALILPGTLRTSIVEPPKYWWIGNQERGVEPAKISTWAWTLGALTDPKSKIEMLDEVSENEKPVAGLRITGTIDPALDMYFEKETYQLVRVDWRDDIYRFSDWQECDGTKYPAKCVMHRRKSGAPWFFHEILELERLKELPVGLERR